MRFRYNTHANNNKCIIIWPQKKGFSHAKNTIFACVSHANHMQNTCDKMTHVTCEIYKFYMQIAHKTLYFACEKNHTSHAKFQGFCMWFAYKPHAKSIYSHAKKQCCTCKKFDILHVVYMQFACNTLDSACEIRWFTCENHPTAHVKFYDFCMCFACGSHAKCCNSHAKKHYYTCKKFNLLACNLDINRIQNMMHRMRN